MTDHKRTYSQRGDDYLLETWKVCEKEKPAPRCPYCGGKMEIETFENYLGWCGQAVCKECKSRAALKRHYVLQEEAEQAAYAAAMQRWREPNRVLTLEEVGAACGLNNEMVLLWVEFNCKGGYTLACQYCTMGQTIATVYMIKPYDEAETNFSKMDYCKRWRCWLRKPTKDEMEDTPWETK